MRKLIKKMVFRIKLWYMDHLWRMSGESCFSLFPPSFYYTHTREEIERITKEEMTMIRELLEDVNESSMMTKC